MKNKVWILGPCSIESEDLFIECLSHINGIMDAEDDWYMKRQKAYGTSNEQIEFITENGLEAWVAKVAEIKAKYPKGEKSIHDNR